MDDGDQLLAPIGIVHPTAKASRISLDLWLERVQTKVEKGKQERERKT